MGNVAMAMLLRQRRGGSRLLGLAGYSGCRCLSGPVFVPGTISISVIHSYWEHGFFFFLLSVCGKMTDVDATQWTVDSVVDLPHEEEILRMFVLILFKIIRDSVVGRFSLVARRLDCTTFAADWPQEGRTKPDGRVRVQ